MATTDVQGPDGKIITVEHPEGASDEDILAFAQQNSQQVDTSPYKPEPRYGGLASPVPGAPNYDPRAAGGAQIPVSGWSPEMLGAAEAGVDIESGAQDLPYGKASFAFDDTQAMDYLKQALDEKYKNPKTGEKADIGVRLGEQSNKPEFLNPNTRRWTLIQPTDLGEQARAFLGPATRFIPETAGALGGAAIGPGPGLQIATGAAGAGLGAASGEYVRTKIGDALGVNTPGNQNLGNAASAGLDAAAADLVGSAVFQTGRLARVVMKGKPAFDETTARALEATQRLNAHLVERIQRETNMPFNIDATFAPDLRALTARQAAAVGEARSEMAKVVRDQEFARKAIERDTQNERTLEMYFDNVTVPYMKDSVQGADGAAVAGRPLKEAIEQQKEAFVNKSQNRYQAAETEGRGLYDSLPSQPYQAQADAGSAVRAEVQKRFDKEDARETQFWGDYQTKIGLDAATNTSKVQVPVEGEAAARLRNFAKRVERTISPRQATARAGLIPDINTKLLSVEDKALLQEFGQSIDDDTVDLAQLDDFVKWLRAKKRMSMEDKVAADFSDKDLLDMERFAVDTRNVYLEKSNPEAYEALLKAEGQSRMKNELFNRGVSADLLSKTAGGEYVLKDSEVLYNIFRRKDVNAARDLAELTKSSPEARHAAQQMVYAMYRQAAFKNGLPNSQKHRAFMEKYKEMIAPFFPTFERRKFASYLHMAEVLGESELAYKHAKRFWKDDPLGGLEHLNSENLTRLVFSGSNKSGLDEIVRLNNRIKKMNPEVIEHWRAGIANEIKLKVLRKDGFDLDAFDKMIAEAGPKLSEVMGVGYVRHLKTIREGLSILEGQAKSVGLPPRQGRLQYALRIAEGPMTIGGRVMTFTGNERGRAYFAKLWSALNDPKELSKLANFTQRQLRTQGALQINATILLDEDSLETN